MKKRKALEEIPIRAITPPVKCIRNSSGEEILGEQFIPANKQLVCIDWDGTLSRGNSYNSARDSFIPIKDETKGVKVFDSKSHIACQEAIKFAISYYFDREEAFHNANSLHYKIAHLIDRGVNIAIVTYNKFPDIIIYGLKQIGFNSEQMSKIHII